MTTLSSPNPDHVHDRTPPHDHAAEQAVLGAMLLSTDAIAAVVDVLEGGDFYRPAHTTIYTAILDLYSRNEPTDPVAVAAQMLGTGDLTHAGGAPYLHELLAAVPTAANAGYYARIVADQARRRRLIEAGTRITRIGYDPTDSDIVAAAQDVLYRTVEHRDSSDHLDLASALPGVLEEIEADGRGDTSALPTGLADLDRIIGGLRSGQLAIVAGRPGLGKSCFALDAARSCAIKRGMTAAIYSLEMGRNEIIKRLLSAESGVLLNRLCNGTLTEDDWTRLIGTVSDVSNAPLIIDDTPHLSVAAIRAKAQLLKRRRDLKLIVVDYLQLMTSPRRTENRQQEVSEISRGLKLLAKEVECPVIAVSQLNRGPEMRQDKRPQLSDLRESGSLEQDADLVLLLHRDDYYDKESPRAGEADLIVAKHRNGPTGTATVAAQLHLSRFVNMHREAP